MHISDLFGEIESLLRGGEPVVLATVIQARGSTPRKEGSRMLVRRGGELTGSIGGGCGEAGVIRKALLSIQDGRVREELADLTEEITLEAEGVCGGTLRVFIQPWLPSEASITLAGRLKELAGGSEPVLFHQVVSDGGGGQAGTILLQDSRGALLLPGKEGRLEAPSLARGKNHQLQRVASLEIYSERWEPEPLLLIVGGGHVAAPLEEMGRLTGFRTVVVDDRRMFANRRRFPHASRLICEPILEAVERFEITPHTYVVLVTRGHALDMEALRLLAAREEQPAYLGMIGSLRRVRAVFQLMEEEGYERERFSHVHAPIGLDIGAETPAEIALAVVAEMVAVRRGGVEETLSLVKKHRVHPAPRPLRPTVNETAKG